MGGNQSAEALRSWRGLHKAALFETDASKLRLRIGEARRALVFRSPEIISASADRDDESVAIQIGLYALQALENCLRLNTKDPRRLAEPLRSLTHVPPAMNSRDSDIEFRQAEALPALRSSGSRSVTEKVLNCENRLKDCSQDSPSKP